MKDDISNSQEDKERDQQRQLLQAFLKESEQSVPSTVSRVMLTIEQEQRIQQATPRASDEEPYVSPLKAGEIQKERIPTRRTRGARPQYVLSSLLIAAILIVIVGIFSRFTLIHSSMNSASSSAGVARPVQIQSISWSSVVIALASTNQTTIANYDPLSGRNVLLATTNAPGQTTIDGVSHDGYRLLYHVYDGTQTSYYIVPQIRDGALYSVPGPSGRGVWSTDDTVLFISTSQGIQQVNTIDGSATLVWKLNSSAITSVPDLYFYHSEYLYFSLSMQKQNTARLQRIHVSTHAVQNVTDCVNASDFWLSPDGATIYYTCGGQDTLHAVNSDGSQPRVFRKNVGQVIGYAFDDAPLTLETTSGNNRVVKLGSTPSLDTVLLDDVAPQAQQVQARDVAVAPYGSGLVVRGVYKDGSQRLWFGDLLKGKSQFIMTIPGASPVQVIGWDRLRMND